MQRHFGGANKENHPKYKRNTHHHSHISYFKKKRSENEPALLQPLCENQSKKIIVDEISDSIWDDLEIDETRVMNTERRPLQTKKEQPLMKESLSDSKRTKQFYNRKMQRKSEDENVKWRQKEVGLKKESMNEESGKSTMVEEAKKEGKKGQLIKAETGLKELKWKRKSVEAKEELEQKKENMGTVSAEDVDKILNKCQQREQNHGFVLYMETVGGPLQMLLPRDFTDLEGLAWWIVFNVQGVERSFFMQAAIVHYVRTQLKNLFS